MRDIASAWPMAGGRRPNQSWQPNDAMTRMRSIVVAGFGRGCEETRDG